MLKVRFFAATLVIAVLAAAAPEIARAAQISPPAAGFSVSGIAPAPRALPSLGAARVIAPAGQPVAAAAPGPIPPGSELTLERAIQIAVKYHPRLLEAAETTNAAGARVGEARSYLGPQLYGASDYLRSTENGIGNTSFYDPLGMFPRMTGRNHNLAVGDFSQSWNTQNNYLGGVSASQFLFDFGRRHGFVTQRRFEQAATAATQKMVELQIIFEVSQRYFAVLQAQQLIRVYKKAIEQREYHLHEAQVKAAAGLRPQLDVYVTKAEVERAQLHLVDARNDFADAKVGLDNAMGLSEIEPNYTLADVLTYNPIKQKLRPLLQTAFALRPDLKALQDQARAMGAQITEYKSDYLPTVNAVAGYAAMGTGLPAANNFNVGLVITWPIFNSFLTTNQVAEARYQRHAIEAGIEDLRQRIIMQVHTAFLNWQASLERIERAQEALAASRVQLSLAEKRYQAGLTNIVELEDAQRHYTYDDATYADALYTYAVDKAAVEEATGEALSGI
ncbi:TolC family protein [bacterium]|nr:TolC family protein [bacterium]